MKPIRLHDVTKFANYKDVKNIVANSISPELGDELLDGLIITGYETKFTGKPNANGQQYTKNAVDKFIKKYFVENELNMPIDIQHYNDIYHTCGRVLKFVVNDTGYHIIGYVPRDYPLFNHVDFLLKNKILQGYSKIGWINDYDIDKVNGGIIINEIEITAMSLVTTPANMVRFDKVETRNALVFVNETTIEESEENKNKKPSLNKMFNPKK